MFKYGPANTGVAPEENSIAATIPSNDVNTKLFLKRLTVGLNIKIKLFTCLLPYCAINNSRNHIR
jgi:hypothetical protein